MLDLLELLSILAVWGFRGLSGSGLKLAHKRAQMVTQVLRLVNWVISNWGLPFALLEQVLLFNWDLSVLYAC